MTVIKDFNRILLALLVVGLASGAFAKDKKEKELPPPSVSIQEGKFKDLRPDAEKSRFNNLRPMVEMVKHELMEAGFSVKDEQDMMDGLKEIVKTKGVDGMEGDEPLLGDMKIPAYFTGIKVLQYGFVSATKQNVESGNVTSKQYLSAQITSTIVDARTGRTIGSANVKAGPLSVATIGGQTGGQSGNFDEQMLQSINQQCAKQIVQYLVTKTPAKFRPAGATGKVLKVADYGVLVKINPEKVKIGDLLDIFQVEALDDDDGDDDGEEEEISEEIYVGSVEVCELKPNYVVCKPLTKDAKFAKKQLARPSTRYKTSGAVAPSTGNTDASVAPF